MNSFYKQSFFALILLLALAVPSFAQSVPDLTTWTSDPRWVFSHTSPFQASDVGREFIVTGGGIGWTKGLYKIVAVANQGVQDGPEVIAYLGYPPASAGASGGQMVFHVANGTRTVICAGNSYMASGASTAGIPGALQHLLGVNYNVLPVGISGQSTSSFSAGYNSQVASHLSSVPSFVVNTEVINSVTHSENPVPYLQNILSLEAADARVAGTITTTGTQASEIPSANYPLLTSSNASIRNFSGTSVVDWASQSGLAYTGDGTHPANPEVWASPIASQILSVFPAPAPPSTEAMTPSGQTLTPNNTLQLGVSGVPSGTTVSSWAITGTPPAGVSVSSSGLLTYGPALPAKTTLNLMATLSDTSTVSGTVTLSPTADTGTPDRGVPDTGVFNGTVGPATNGYINLLIKNFGIPAILASLAVCGWLLLRRFARHSLSS